MISEGCDSVDLRRFDGVHDGLDRDHPAAISARRTALRKRYAGWGMRADFAVHARTEFPGPVAGGVPSLGSIAAKGWPRTSRQPSKALSHGSSSHTSEPSQGALQDLNINLLFLSQTLREVTEDDWHSHTDSVTRTVLDRHLQSLQLRSEDLALKQEPTSLCAALTSIPTRMSSSLHAERRPNAALCGSGRGPYSR